MAKKKGLLYEVRIGDLVPCLLPAKCFRTIYVWFAPHMQKVQALQGSADRCVVHSVRCAGFFYKSGLAIDADGASRAYHPSDRLGLDSLAHAGHRGDWWALVTDSGKTSGRPVVQGKSDPAPGYYVSTTALYDPNNPNTRDPHRYVDAATIPYIVLHPKALNHARLGDFATVVNFQNGKISAAIVADESAPDLPVGEGSIALAEALGINSSPRHGGKDGGVAYLIYPGSGNGRPRPLKEIVANSNQLFAAWGGFDRLKSCSADE